MVECGDKWVQVERWVGVQRFAIKDEVEQMFLGQYEHSIDEKGRMTIPARYRELLEGGAFITQGFDQNLIIMTTRAFEQVYQRVNQMNLTNPVTRQLKRLIFSHADKVVFDRAGRILIPSFLRESVGLKDQAMVVGVGGYFEVWSPENWALQDEQLQDAETNNQRFAALDLSINE